MELCRPMCAMYISKHTFYVPVMRKSAGNQYSFFRACLMWSSE